MEIKIRPLCVEDAYTSVQWRNDPEVFKYTKNTYDHVITIESELSWIKRVIVNANEYRCAIIADDRYVGNIYLTKITDESAVYQIFIGDKSYWGKGVAQEASLLILRYAFNELKLQCVRLSVNEKNVRAINLYENVGFQTISKENGWLRMEIRK